MLNHPHPQSIILNQLVATMVTSCWVNGVSHLNPSGHCCLIFILGCRDTCDRSATVPLEPRKVPTAFPSTSWASDDAWKAGCCTVVGERWVCQGWHMETSEVVNWSWMSWMWLLELQLLTPVKLHWLFHRNSKVANSIEVVGLKKQWGSLKVWHRSPEAEAGRYWSRIRWSGTMAIFGCWAAVKKPLTVVDQAVANGVNNQVMIDSLGWWRYHNYQS